MKAAKPRRRRSAPTSSCWRRWPARSALYSSTGGVELVPGIAQEFGLRVTVGAWIDKHADRNERELTAAIELARRYSNVQQRDRRQRDHLPRRPNGRRAHQENPARQARDQRSGDHRRNLARLAGASRAGFGGRLHRRARAALLGRLFRRTGRRPGDPDLRQAARDLSRQAHRDRRIRLAERRLQPQSRRARPPRAGRGACASSSRAPTLTASTTTSSRPSISRGRFSKAASVPIGACSTPSASRNSSGPARSPISDHWRIAGIALLISVLLSLPILP